VRVKPHVRLLLGRGPVAVQDYHSDTGAQVEGPAGCAAHGVPIDGAAVVKVLGVQVELH
jgi:hypothetical protein